VSVASIVVPRRPRAGGGHRQRRSKTPPLANCGVIVQRCGTRSSEAGSTWLAAVGGGHAVARRTALRRWKAVPSASRVASSYPM